MDIPISIPISRVDLSPNSPVKQGQHPYLLHRIFVRIELMYASLREQSGYIICAQLIFAIFVGIDTYIKHT